MLIKGDETLEELEAITENCSACDLCKHRNKIVFGEGNPHADIMCIGEGPGYYEDREGKPFIGKSGQLLDKIFHACGLDRYKDIYIGNIVKCHPPENRNPTTEERNTCIQYLFRQIDLIDPKIIILLGGTALKGLFDPNARITQVRGKWLLWENRWVMPTFHPSALLRNQNLKADAWSDFQKVIKKYREIHH
ncbi:MAG: uracil-DNA glycosylase [Bacteroidales bacterium]